VTIHVLPGRVRRALRTTGIMVAIIAAGIPAATAHGFAGKRFFPATVATEDPFVADELSLPTVSWRRLGASDEAPALRETAFAIDMSKRITERLGIGFGATYKVLRPGEGERQSGFDNLEASVKYQLFTSAEHEAIVSAGVDWDIGGSGSRRVGAESFSTITPAVFFGKGFGDLSDDMRYGRPFALTGSVGVGFPTRSATRAFDDEGEASVERHPHTLAWNFALEYSIPYLQSFVKDVGIGAPFDRMIPVVELAMSTPLDRGRGGTTGTINPGVLWAGTYAQVSLEAVIPVNDRSGKGVGWLAQVHFFLDDLFPSSLGRPLVAR
jgi:hypothetical protein